MKTENRNGNREIEKKIKEKGKQRRIGIDFGHLWNLMIFINIG